ncbi:KTSC domain-containing protein [Crocinitomix catalasitica]|uniref:KTSC domain-containing protein n=1 Tax=Crocinitomix catalasitica TaxID=184607 RepID=UPI00047F0BF4|nr:KTSC domain-containing protein [Crocinitomix catalasitica]
MKRINEYKKLFNVEPTTDLKQLKTTYRNLVKEWHPDKFQAGDEKAAEAELKSQQIIDAYHFLVSIAPETKVANQAEYDNLINVVGISDFQHKKQVLEVTFLDGSTYEYFGVSPKVYQKMVNTDKLSRFAKRSIYNSYLYRKSKNGAKES